MKPPVEASTASTARCRPPLSSAVSPSRSTPKRPHSTPETAPTGKGFLAQPDNVSVRPITADQAENLQDAPYRPTQAAHRKIAAWTLPALTAAIIMALSIACSKPTPEDLTRTSNPSPTPDVSATISAQSRVPCDTTVPCNTLPLKPSVPTSPTARRHPGTHQADHNLHRR